MMHEEIQKKVSHQQVASRGGSSTSNGKGHNVVLEQSYGAPKVTKDGVIVAKSIDFVDKVKNFGASLVKQVANATNDVAGDGTTCSTMLTRAILAEGCKSVADRMNAMDLRHGITIAVDVVVANLKNRARMISTSEEIAQDATIAANGKREIGELTAKAMEKVGKEGVITISEPAIDTMNEIQAFLSANPNEIVTIILEDYVQAPNGLTKLFQASGLTNYWFPLSKMPQNGQDWPLVSDMVANNQRLLVFTSIRSKQDTEGIAYQWNYMVENQYGDGGMKAGQCSNRAESAPLNNLTKSLVLVNYFPSIPVKETTCVHNSADLMNMLHTCYGAASNRWANFVAVDYYKRSEGGGAPQATDMLNGKLLCGCDDVHACAAGSTSGACTAP